MKLDKDLKKLNKGATSSYSSHREPVLGQAQIFNIQSIRNLEKTIKKLDKQNLILNTRMYWLSIIGGILVVTQLFKHFIDFVNWIKNL